MNNHFNIHLDDINYIVEACKRRKVDINQHEAYRAWQNYSDMYAASWIRVPRPDAKRGQEACDRMIIKSIETGRNWSNI